MIAPTPAQWEAIRAVDEHLLVAAGAGTGKTTTVVGRILYLLGAEIEGQRIAAPLALRDVAAITFTNAGAADLKTKLRDGLRGAGLADAAYEVDGARIGTIHGFCGAVLREFALRAGRNPAVRILEEGEAGALVAEAVHDAVLDAIEARQVPGLDELFSVWSVGDVEGWLCRLAADGSRLDRIAERAGELGPLERTVVKLAGIGRAMVERRLMETGAVDFDRMIVWTRDLLARDAAVRRALQRRIHTLVIDEFQDVDPVQREIAYLLGEPGSRRPDTTRLMLVGDPKQSIYRFRRADVTVWSAVQRDFEEEKLGRVVALDRNYRSVPAVLGFVDATVGRVLDRPIDGVGLRAFEVAYAAVEAEGGKREAQGGRRKAEGEAGGRTGGQAVELIAVAGADGERIAAGERRRAEADAVAARALELNAAGVRWAEMAVLLAAWSDLAIYEAALRRAKVPTYALNAEGFYNRREVLDLLLALETVRDPSDDRALLGFLRSPFVGLRDETLLDIARQAEQPYWQHLAGVRVREQELLDWGVALVREHVALRDRAPTHELLERMLDRSGYRAHLVALGRDGEQPLANVRKLVAIARGQRDRNVGDFLRMVRDVRERGDRESDARLYGQGEDVVTITSIHSAKGLEWRVVFWCDLARTLPNGGPDLVIGREAIALKDPDAKTDAQPAPYVGLLERERAEQFAESKRLWYVATTRAKERLVLSGFAAAGSRGECPGDTIRGELGDVPMTDGAPVSYRDHNGDRYAAVVRVVTAATEARAEADRPPFAAAEIPPLVPVLSAPPGRARHSATELMTYARCAKRHWFKYVAGVREPEVSRTGADWMSAIARGQIVHDVLEHVEAEEEFDDLLEAAIGRWDESAPPPESEPGRRYREALAREIDSVRGHAGYRALDDTPGRKRELPFLHVLGPDAFVEGKVDLAAPDGDGLAILDVKTGDGDAAALERKAAGYALQRDVYVSALDALAGRRVTSFAFHFARSGVQVGGALAADAGQAAAEEVARVIAGMGAAAPALTRYPAECRFCGYKRVGWCEGVREPTG